MLLMWPSFGDYVVMSSNALHCDDSPNNVRTKSHGYSQVAGIWEVYCEVTMSAKVAKWHKMTLFWCQLGTRHKTTITMILNWSFQMTVIWQSQSDFIVTSPGDSSQSNHQSDISVITKWHLFESNNEANVRFHILIQRSDYDTCDHSRRKSSVT